MDKTPFNEVAERVGDNFDRVRSELDERTREISDGVRSFVEHNPLGAVGIAFGVGYLLSGALVSRTTLRVIGLGGRIALGAIAKQLLAGVGQDAEREEATRS